MSSTLSKLKSKYRTHLCHELRAEDDGKNVILSGWVHRKRDHGGIVFIDLRDNYGVTQVLADASIAEKLNAVRVESVIEVHGTVVKRDSTLVNDKIPTGMIEVKVSSFNIHSTADVLPFTIADPDSAPESQRLQYRFLELRRDELHTNILLRSKVISSIREIMQGLGFTEFQTPILTSSSPEGARDFLVPSRFHPGKFFALPQAPQQFKQLLMVSGFDRYFQIAPCFRDEDPRADRSPGEFYQCDMEMSFVEQEDVFQVGETLMHSLFTRFTQMDVTPPPFPRIKYNDSVAWYGNDKPDLRVPLKIQNVSDILKDTEFKVFRNELDMGGGVFAIGVSNATVPSRKYFDDTIDFFKGISGTGLGYLIIQGGEVKGTIAKFFKEEEVSALRQKFEVSGDTVIFFGAGGHEKILPSLGKLRVKTGNDFGLAEKGFKFCWITDYPMYERDEITGEIVFSHNPFSMPQGGMEALQNQDPLTIHAYQYDIVCNGYELSSGAIRNHSPEIMYKAFEIAGYSKETVDEKFGGMIKAFKFGAPPHGGMAPGVDRIVMLLAQKDMIRDVIAFPMAQTVEDLMMGAPSTVNFKQLNELHIQLKPVPPKVEK
jgi:aspartyl-tRNA synthetase